MKTHLSTAIPLVFVVGLVLALVRSGGGGETASGHSITATPGVPQFHVEIDMVRDGNTFCNPVDDSGTGAVGSTYRVAVCATDLPLMPDNGGDHGVGSFQFDLLYDKTLNSCTDKANTGRMLDDNPDTNAGNTVWPNPVTGDDLGGGWDCTGFGYAYPECDVDLTGDPANLGRARIVCVSFEGPWTLGDNETEGVLATVRFNVIGTGPDTLHLENVAVKDEAAVEIGSCNPDVALPIPCFDATDDKTPATPTPTSVPVGGVAELPAFTGTSADKAGAPAEGSSWSAAAYAVLAGIGALAATTIAAGAWYARRRWLR